MKHNPTKLFQVEIVDSDHTKKKLAKLHYIDYSRNDDVWVDDKKNDICPTVKITKCSVPSAIRQKIPLLRRIYLQSAEISVFPQNHGCPMQLIS